MMILPSQTSKLEGEDEAVDRKPKLLDGNTRVKPEDGQGDNIQQLETSRLRRPSDRLEAAAKVEDVKKVEETTSGLRDDSIRELSQHRAELGGPGVQSAGSDVTIRDGKALRAIEVVLPRWNDVLRRKSLQAQSEPLAIEQQMPADPGSGGREVTQVPGEPDVDVSLLSAEGSDLQNASEHNPGPAEVAQAIREMHNPDVKVKKELMMSDEYLLHALTWEGINHRFPIPVPPEIAEFTFPRAYISNLYGGNLQATFPRPNPDFVEWHGLRGWAFLTLEWNPHAPTRPGVSGLFFEGTRHAVDDMKDVLRTFVRVQSGKWVYMGQYRFRPGKSLTAESWKQQSEVVRRTWAQGYLRYSGTSVCVRVWLRKQRGSDYEVTKEDYEAAQPKMKEIQSSITEEDINGAFDRGEEAMGVYTMTCVGYDADFVRLLVRNAHLWNPPAPMQKQGELNRKARKGTGSKRKPLEADPNGERSSGGADEAFAGRPGSVDEDVKPIPTSSAPEMSERRSTRVRVKRVRTS